LPARHGSNLDDLRSDACCERAHSCWWCALCSHTRADGLSPMADGARCSIRQPKWSRFRLIFRSSTLPSNIRAHLTSDLCVLLSPIEGFDKKISICGLFVTAHHKAQFEGVEIEIGACRFFEKDGVVFTERFKRSSMRKRFYPTQRVLFRRMFFASKAKVTMQHAVIRTSIT
jgi:hypothetical protein